MDPGGQARIGVIVLCAIALLPPFLVMIACWFYPIGDLGADRIAMAARDYTDMWAAGHLVAVGKLDTLFDVEVFNTALRSMFGSGFTHQVWPYPPPILLLAVPLSMLPLLPGFVLYTAGLVALLWRALRSGGLTRAASAAVLFSPAVADNALTGQNGSLTGALLFGGLSLVHRRPLLSGAMLGALIIKPQLGLLVPVCLIASGRWRALLGTAVSVSLLIALSYSVFGLNAWVGFFVHTPPMIATITGAPWEATPSQRIFASVFMAARSVGASMQVANGLQITATIICVVVAWRAWRIPNVDPMLRAALTALLAVAAAPWVHSYDMIPLSVAVTMLAATANLRMRVLLGFAWLWPGAAVVVPIPLPLSVGSVACIAWLAWRQMRRGDGLVFPPIQRFDEMRVVAGQRWPTAIIGADCEGRLAGGYPATDHRR